MTRPIWDEFHEEGEHSDFEADFFDDDEPSTALSSHGPDCPGCPVEGEIETSPAEMTRDRIEELRDLLHDDHTLGAERAKELLAALDALRAKVAMFERMANAGIARMIERANTMEGDDQLASAAMAQAVSTMLDEGRKLGLFEEAP